MSELLDPSRTPEQDAEATAAFRGVRPQEILFNAKICLETLLRIYYLRHGFDHLDAACTGFLIQQGFICIEDMTKTSLTNDSDAMARRSTLILVAKGLYDQGKSVHFARVLYQLLYEQMPRDAVDELGRFAGMPVTWRGHLRVREIRSEYVVSTSAAEPNRVGDLIQGFKEGTGELSSDDSATP